MQKARSAAEREVKKPNNKLKKAKKSKVSVAEAAAT